MTTIIQVAAVAGVSTATVSRVLSQPDRVALATRDRVLQVVEELGYRPNVAARSLRTLRAAKILLTVPDISNPFFATVIRGAEEAARDAGYAMVLGDTRHDPEVEDQYADMLSRREVDGLIFLGHRLPANLAPIVGAGGARKGAGAPIVNACEFSPDLPVPSVHIDNAAASSDGLEYLIGLGHRRIGIITGPAASPMPLPSSYPRTAPLAAETVRSPPKLRTNGARMLRPEMTVASSCAVTPSATRTSGRVMPASTR